MFFIAGVRHVVFLYMFFLPFGILGTWVLTLKPVWEASISDPSSTPPPPIPPILVRFALGGFFCANCDYITV